MNDYPIMATKNEVLITDELGTHTIEEYTNSLNKNQVK